MLIADWELREFCAIPWQSRNFVNLQSAICN